MTTFTPCDHCPSATACERWGYCNAEATAVGQSKRQYPNLPRSQTNPNGEPTGPYTGRCSKCGSNNLWDDVSYYGCNNCGAIYRN